MKVFKNKWFARFARNEAIEDEVLCATVAYLERGLIDADLGGGVIKQRLARPQGGKSGGFRTILLFRCGDRAIFVYAFAKSRRANLRRDEVVAFKRLASEFLKYDAAALAKAVASGALIEVLCDEIG
ncbi:MULTISPECIES: type II toxin-antitoxin system RelE/ParE family toxin [Afifella]|uniref:type II toxin-antitoxin system RelE/ParE family toxin n=1 Tax=Afifella TaxID=643217 RepID=UPI000FE31010|nr:type II toxin-antitoxin system RelE/ParE family toxin [Afifella aestuarii]